MITGINRCIIIIDNIVNEEINRSIINLAKYFAIEISKAGVRYYDSW